MTGLKLMSWSLSGSNLDKRSVTDFKFCGTLRILSVNSSIKSETFCENLNHKNYIINNIDKIKIFLKHLVVIRNLYDTMDNMDLSLSTYL